jgi:CheY-like chemotaxis protein
MSSVKVLLVDDVRLFLEFERSFFERAGCVILTAGSGEEALRLAREEKPHIVLLDYEMPGMMGDEVCRHIRESEQTRHIPVLIVTSHRSPQIQERCIKAGCTDFLTKPVSGRELLDKVVKILAIPYRVHMRTRVSMEVRLASGGESAFVIGYSEDLSEGGMLLETLQPLEAGGVIRVGFRFPGQSGEDASFDGEAEVVRVDRAKARGRYSVALKFRALQRVQQERIRGYVLQEVGK